MRCQVEGLSRPLRLTVTGTCVGAPASRDVYHVTTSVRQRETKSLPVSNQTTGVTYNLRPVIDGAEHFSGPETLTVPPSSTRNYELTYQPLTMTTDGKKHTVGTLSDRPLVALCFHLPCTWSGQLSLLFTFSSKPFHPSSTVLFHNKHRKETERNWLT